MDLYNREKRLQNAESLVKASIISQRDKDLIFKFETYLFSINLSALRAEKNLRVLRLSAETLNTPFEDVTKDKLETFFAHINRQDRSSWNKRDYHLILKRFYRWLGKEEFVKILNNAPKGKSKAPQLLSTSEIDITANRTPHPRDKAMITGLYDLGARCGEWFSDLKIGDFIFEDRLEECLIEVKPGLFKANHVSRSICFVSIFGKTGNRTVELEKSTPYLEAWIKAHPDSRNPKAYMWVDEEGNPLFKSYEQVIAYVRAIISRAGIQKHITFQSFRHGRMTDLADKLMKTYLKGRQGTSQLSTYVHLDNGIKKFG